MNTYIITILTSISVLYSQFSTNNLNGFGNDEDVLSTVSESMGQMWMNNSNENNWDPLLASSIFNSDLTRICVGSSIRSVKSESYKSLDHMFEFINFSFPFRNNMGISIGLSPSTTTNYIFNEVPSIIGGTEYSSPISSQSSHIIEGGISKLSLALSKAILNKKTTFAIGLKWNILFGNQEVNSTSMLSQISYDQQGNQNLTLIETVYDDTYNHFNAYQYEFDSRVTFNNKNNFSFLISLLDNFKVDNSKVTQLFSSSNSYLVEKAQLDRLGIGYMYNANDQFGIAVEFHLKNSINYPEEILLFRSKSPSRISFHNGLYKRFNNIKSGSWNSINLSMGYNYKIIKFTNQNLRDISISLGGGILFNESKNNLDISFTIGVSESIVEAISYESYYKLNVAIFSGDQWFKQRRRK